MSHRGSHLLGNTNPCHGVTSKQGFGLLLACAHQGRRGPSHASAPLLAPRSTVTSWRIVALQGAVPDVAVADGRAVILEPERTGRGVRAVHRHLPMPRRPQEGGVGVHHQAIMEDRHRGRSDQLGAVKACPSGKPA